MEEKRYTLRKAERVNSKTVIDKLFGGGNKSFASFPLRAVYMYTTPEESESEVSILISVPKKRFKRAVKRNLVKRQIREAYRKNKHILIDALSLKEKRLILAFIWIDNSIHSSSYIEERVKRILLHISDNLE